MPSVDYTTYYSYAPLVSALEGFVVEYPHLASLQSIGQSFEGRDLWLLTLTNLVSGAPTEKPSFWLDANLHATEVTGSMAALHVIETLLKGYGSDDLCTRLLDTTTFYILPRLNPDGAERALTTPHGVRSSVRRYPHPERKDGLYPADLNDDGMILQMRLPDPHGDWRISEHDGRVMVKRRPDETGGTYYRLLPEGLIQNYDGVTIQVSPPLEGLDINRNFPASWRPEAEQRGAGPFPTSEPEIRAVVEFLTTHPEIHSALTYHTFSGVLLRPFSAQADEQFPHHDLAVYTALGKRGTELTGYPAVSVYHDFRYHPKEVISGVFDDWAYDHLGIFAWTVELWDLASAAGIKDRKFIDWLRDHPEEDDLKLMRWSDEYAGDHGFVAWQPFEHPQLGPVEIGGWPLMYGLRNPPPALLLQTCEPVTRFALASAAIAPLLRIVSFSAAAVGPDLYRLQAIVQNDGFLPTYGSERAKERRSCRPLRASLTLPEDATLALGELQQEIDHLEGRSAHIDRWASENTSHRAELEWLVRAQGGEVSLHIEGGRGGNLLRPGLF